MDDIAGRTAFNPTDRYSATFLRDRNLVQINEFFGNQVEMKIVEKLKIYNHFIVYGDLPPGNRIFR
ncbi:MAG TPA: hypothetical protein VMW19_18425 [Myxococcota bacterium]|nr:hypothetical protein [Myxococcota bacterium]